MQKPKNLPLNPGVYQFRDEKGSILYIGKAKNLKNRLNSYFTNDLLPKTREMITRAKTVSYIKVMSEFEALLLEANLIKKYKPHYNTALKDDKSPLYIAITKDKYPRIITLRKPELENYLPHGKAHKLKSYYGPYITGLGAKTLLKRIRRIYPFTTHLPEPRVCIYHQIGLCNPCPSQIENELDKKKRKELNKIFLRNVRGIKNILNGKLKTVEKELEKEIKEYAKDEKFEMAGQVSKHLEAFRNIALNQDVDVEEYLKNPNLEEDIREEELVDLQRKLTKAKLQNLKTRVRRIECFDIAHLAGSFPTASMVTFIDGSPEKKYYRHFKIYQKKKQSDIDSMREVVTRRLKHLDWGIPDLVIIDGGKPQLSAIHGLFERKGIPFVGLAKRFETIVIRNPDGKFMEIKASLPSLKLLQRIRDEAHRFARRLHHKQIKANIS